MDLRNNLLSIIFAFLLFFVCRPTFSYQQQNTTEPIKVNSNITTNVDNGFHISRISKDISKVKKNKKFSKRINERKLKQITENIEALQNIIKSQTQSKGINKIKLFNQKRQKTSKSTKSKTR